MKIIMIGTFVGEGKTSKREYLKMDLGKLRSRVGYRSMNNLDNRKKYCEYLNTHFEEVALLQSAIEYLRGRIRLEGLSFGRLFDQARGGQIAHVQTHLPRERREKYLYAFDSKSIFGKFEKETGYWGEEILYNCWMKKKLQNFLATDNNMLIIPEEVDTPKRRDTIFAEKYHYLEYGDEVYGTFKKDNLHPNGVQGVLDELPVSFVIFGVENSAFETSKEKPLRSPQDLEMVSRIQFVACNAYYRYGFLYWDLGNNL